MQQVDVAQPAVRGSRRRLDGVDAARAVALAGMVAVHVVPYGDPLDPAVLPDLAGGRSAALFAVLAGVGLALASGGQTPPTGSRWARLAAATLVRAVLVAAVGLALAELDTGVAVILVYYGLLFVVAAPLLPLRPLPLAVIAVVVAVVVPIVSLSVRADLAPPETANISFDALLEDPLGSLVLLLLTGYYPVLAWAAYLCAGLAAGRLDLRARGTAVLLLVGGAALAVLSALVSAVLLGPAGGLSRMAPGPDDPRVVAELDEGLFGNVPAGETAWWLAVDVPHSSTPLDLLHTTGTALAVLGLALLLAPLMQNGALPRVVLAPLAAAGSMPLSLYTLHLVVLDRTEPLAGLDSWALQVLGALVLATAWRRWVGRGPLEAVIAAAVRPLRPAAAARTRPT